MNDKNILFVINLLSGTRKDRHFLINAIRKEYPESEIFVLKSKEDFSVCLNKAKDERYAYIVINGGDGTINSFLPILIEHKKILGILPSGSGNGLARTLGIPLQPLKALEVIKQCKFKAMDVGKLTYVDTDYHSKYFSCAVGFGIDANIAYRFEQQKIRGLIGYLISSLKEWMAYQPVRIEGVIDNTIFINGQFLIVSIMNIPQYGNDFYVIPSAIINDGILNIVTLNKISSALYPIVLWNLIMKREKKPLKYYKGKKILLRYIVDHMDKNPLYYHIDGEPYKVEGNTQFEIEILSNQLHVMMPH